MTHTSSHHARQLTRHTHEQTYLLSQPPTFVSASQDYPQGVCDHTPLIISQPWFQDQASRRSRKERLPLCGLISESRSTYDKSHLTFVESNSEIFSECCVMHALQLVSSETMCIRTYRVRLRRQVLCAKAKYPYLNFDRYLRRRYRSTSVLCKIECDFTRHTRRSATLNSLSFLQFLHQQSDIITTGFLCEILSKVRTSVSRRISGPPGPFLRQHLRVSSRNQCLTCHKRSTRRCYRLLQGRYARLVEHHIPDARVHEALHICATAQL